MPALASACTVYALDLPGVGYSGRLQERECNLNTNAQRLLAFMTACGAERADLLGNSHGGAIAMMAAALAPQRVYRLLLAAPVNPWMRERRLLISLAGSSAGGMLMRLVAPRLGTLHGYFLRRMYGDPRRIAAGTLQGYSIPIQIPGTLEHLLAIMRCWRSDLAELARIMPVIRSIPTLLLWGTLDGAVNLGSATQLQQAFDDCQLEIFPGAGHLPYEEFPADFNQRVLNFLRHKKAAGV
jgi:pimeloyl-ACP methyl ester carboxylesterase